MMSRIRKSGKARVGLPPWCSLGAPEGLVTAPGPGALFDGGRQRLLCFRGDLCQRRASGL
jgi:hypothetical protein